MKSSFIPASNIDNHTPAVSKKPITINVVLKWIGVLIIASFLVPATRIGFTFKPDLPLAMTASLLLIEEKKIARLPIIVIFKGLAATIFASMLISNNIGNWLVDTLGQLLIFPTEFIQIFSRVFTFYAFTYIGYYQIISQKTFHLLVSTTFGLALLWALMQALDIGIVKSLSSNFYALTELQKNVLESAKTRIFGTAGNAITWGGLSGLMFFYFYFVYKGNKALKWISILLSAASLFYSSSRSALFAFILTMLIMQFAIPFYKAKGIKLFWALISRSILTLVSLIIILIAAALLVPDRVVMIITRIDNTEEDLTEEGRGGQLNFFLEMFGEHTSYYITGIGKPTLDSLNYMEMEPFFILFAYGVIGLLLHYTFLITLILTAKSLKRQNLDYHFFIIAATIFYFIFSFGFFFFREIVAGLPFWWLCGYFIGVMYASKHNQNQPQCSTQYE